LSERRKLLICGATGFIGRNLVEAFAGNPEFDVIAVWHRRPPYEIDNVTWRQADLTDGEQVTRCLEGVDIVLQAAATTSGSKDIVTRPHIHVTDNAVMNSLLLRAVHDLGISHFLFFSCTVMYQSSEAPLSESDFNESVPLYPNYFGVGWTKVYVEKMCEFFSRQGDAKFTVIRHSNIYGPHDKFDLERSHVFGATMTKVCTAADGKVTVWGTGEEARDLLYVGDLVDFVRRAIERQSANFALYNCGAGEAVAIRRLVEMIVEAENPSLAIEHDLSKPTIKTSLFLDCSLALEELGWKPSVSLSEGIARTLRWWHDNIGAQQS
jgi:GDP-L-fucose synthase